MRASSRNRRHAVDHEPDRGARLVLLILDKPIS